MDSQKYAIVESNINGPYHSLSPFEDIDAEKFFCMMFIMQICRDRDDIVNEYCQLNKDNLILQKDKDTFYDILCLNDLISAFMEFCANTKGITVEDKYATIKTDESFYRIDIVKCDDLTS